MATYRVKAFAKKDKVLEKEFGGHFDLACIEFSKLMCSLNYDSIYLEDDYSTISTFSKPKFT